MGKDKITTLSNEYTKEVKKHESMKIRYKHFSRRRIAGLAILSIILFTYPTIELVKSFSVLVDTKTELHQIQKKSEQASDEVESNQRKVKQLEDNDYVAKVARNRYYYSKDGEQVYRLPDTNQGE
ncbi:MULTISPECIES: septum formation initiator family protein [unclassified Enterococcus]|uniref:FtsB family cell division protein n=1 Tax=unclassified Enterococcus TaxID=2608891 RepID=UPI001553011B|nr:MULTISPECIES: septum formation initiator family protein [unclassified Enterococcus]MBS7578276.1 septum formation initiator family protein [Enterococcus sp. MMGLQ5-2]MBS7585456.1 septum formation initiator family protein [Enterococcus sp. MMGLQ5-1]NPD13313.1 hypothetical protein [Enterococcus sp. MMGLQ5-1]NPD38107.1 hypothetical protein [Enterococcus sp. MMGLQ5-2]